MCAVLVAITTDSSTTTPAVELLPNPTLKNISEASSVHVLAFSSKGDLLLVESEGEFVVDEWERVYEVAREACLGDRRLGKEDGGDERSRDVEMEEDGDKEGLLWKMQRVVGEKVESEQRWKKDLGQPWRKKDGPLQILS
ncbi:uncharacterized protein KY384_008249 [Bacidia gigantensis]|uniref:uncharacterized protein n=1 Tax=Bacidia gigantensis TaxID=2732470 RepID=UPI001D040995|nr:uncharacterized protein KY384_008249 [Bacidia gigantensis]KAG8526820.1 hypothetical protein KY384_008249 [Bacidia gigantensis]